MKRRYEILKTKQIKKKLIELIENEANNDIKITESKEVKIGEVFALPIYIDLEGYTTEKLNEIIEENYDEIIEEILSEDFINTLALTFLHLKEKEIKVNFKVTNRDDDNEECLNLLLEY